MEGDGGALAAGAELGEGMRSRLAAVDDHEGHPLADNGRKIKRRDGMILWKLSASNSQAHFPYFSRN